MNSESSYFHKNSRFKDENRFKKTRTNLKVFSSSLREIPGLSYMSGLSCSKDRKRHPPDKSQSIG